MKMKQKRKTNKTTKKRTKIFFLHQPVDETFKYLITTQYVKWDTIQLIVQTADKTNLLYNNPSLLKYSMTTQYVKWDIKK
jgi:hypothetical protein